MIEVIEGVVLLTTPYNDTSSIVNVLTADYGRLSFLLSNSRSPKSAVKRTHFQPLSRVELVADIKQDRAVHSIKESRMMSHYSSMLSNPGKRMIALFLSELLHRLIRSEDSDRGMYAFVADSLEVLELTEDQYANFHLIFLVGIIRIFGFYPRVEQYTEGSCFDLMQGEFMDWSTPTTVSPMETSLLYRVLSGSYSEMSDLRMTREERNRTLDILLEYIRKHNLPTLQIKSLDVLREL